MDTVDSQSGRVQVPPALGCDSHGVVRAAGWQPRVRRHISEPAERARLCHKGLIVQDLDESATTDDYAALLQKAADASARQAQFLQMFLM